MSSSKYYEIYYNILNGQMQTYVLFEEWIDLVKVANYFILLVP